MFIWFDQVWKSYAETKIKGIGFHQIVNGKWCLQSMYNWWDESSIINQQN